MKYKNKQYIVSDNDILMTGKNDLGKNLHEIIDNQQESIDQLKKNVKWLYKYGGVGGNGGGSGSNKPWGIKATLDGKDINGKESGEKTIILNEPGKYKIFIAIERASKDTTYRCRFQYLSFIKPIILTESEGWRTEFEIELDGNGEIIIEVDNTVDFSKVYCNYITEPIIISDLFFKKKDGNLYPDIKDYYISEDLKNNGLIACVNYQAPIDGTKLTYSWKINNTTTEPIEIVNDSAKSGVISYNFPDNILEDNESAGGYTVSLNIIVEITINKVTTQIEIIKRVAINLIPSNLYLSIFAENGQLYNEATNNPVQFPAGSNMILNYTLYNGVNSNSYDIGTITFYINNETQDNKILDTDIKYVTPKTTSLTLGISKLNSNFEEPNTLIISIQIGKYSTKLKKYFYCKEGNSINWYLPGKSLKDRSFYNPNESSVGDNYYSIYPDTKTVDGENLYFNNCYVGNDKYYTLITDTIGKSIFNRLKKISSDVGTSSYDTCIHIGIQYSKVNNYDNPIIKLYDTEDEINSASTAIIEIYPEKIQYLNSSCNFFLKRENIFNPGDNTKYSLITITQKTISTSTINAQVNLKEFTVYIDGVLEGSTQNLTKDNISIAQIEFCPGNYSINLIEQSHIASTAGNIEYKNIFNDIDVVRYYYKYKADLLSSDENEISRLNTLNELISSFLTKRNNSEQYNDYSYAISNSQLKLNNSGIIDSISKSIDIPSMMLSIEDTDQRLLSWLNTRRNTEETDSSSDEEKDIKALYYSTGNSALTDNNNLINEPTNYYDFGVQFKLKLQGSSTLRYHSKNFILRLKNNQDDSSFVPLFSPNFDINDKNTFLPETEFTLKADAVDSSHSNNVAIGKFVNNACDFKYLDGITEASSYSKHVKRCLTGFPILLFLHTIGPVDDFGNPKNDYYYLGIYNFNLGRSSHNNLGYTNLNNFSKEVDKLGEDGIGSLKKSGNFIFSKGEGTGNTLKIRDNILVAEIQGNNKNYDFHQTDKSILFEDTNNKDNGNFMFGDIVFGGNTNIESAKNQIQKFIRSIAISGGYLFRLLGKTFRDVNISGDDGKTFTGYNLIDDAKTTTTTVTVKDSSGNSLYSYEDTKYVTYVPDVTKQYIRNTLTGDLSLKVDGEKITEDLLSLDNLKQCLYGSEKDNAEKSLNFESLLDYYVICMAFGLVDSVQKNLNIKSWNALPSPSNNYVTTFGAFFYDMDTCLGIDNEGKLTNYFCFSDYWKELLDNSGTKIIRSDVIRDYYPVIVDNDSSEEIEIAKYGSGFDIPSSYLFSIAKYSNSVLTAKKAETVPNSPQNKWAFWRQVGYALENAENFIDKYFKSHISNLPETILNLNYRTKYLNYDGNNNTSLNKSEYDAFKGTRINRTIDWLNKRFHLLDAYFNIVGNNTILYKDNNITIQEPLINKDYQTGNNPDVIIKQDIFSNTVGNGISRDTANITIDITTQKLSPTCIIAGNGNTIQFTALLESENPETTYSIPLTVSGKQTVWLGGSKLWKSITKNSLNNLISSIAKDGNNAANFYIDSENLQIIEADKGNLNGTWELKTPSVRTIKLNSKEFSGSLSINSENNLMNLVEVDLSNSKICADIEDINTLETLKLVNVSPGNSGDNKLNIINCRNLKTLDLSIDTEVTGFGSLYSLVYNSVNLNPCAKLGNSNNTLNLSTVDAVNMTITANNSDASDYTKFILNSSSYLKELTITDFNNIDVNSCINLETLTIYINRANTFNNAGLRDIKITNCEKLKTLIIDTIPGETTDDTPPNIELSNLNLSGCTELSEICLVNYQQVNNEIPNSIIKYDNLNNINISGTKLKDIKFIYKTKNGKTNTSNLIVDNTITTNYNGQPCIDLSIFPKIKNISNFQISDNSEIRYIKVPNIKESPFILDQSISGCNELRRLLGCYQINDSVKLSSLPNFTIHGIGSADEVISWNSIPVLKDKRIQMPSELFPEATNLFVPDTVSETKINSKTDSYLHTNIVFKEGITSLESLFYGSSVTIFDIYYILDRIPETVTNIDSCFNLGANNFASGIEAITLLRSNILRKTPDNSDPNRNYYWFTGDNDNSLNNNSFHKCNNLTTLNYVFRGRAYRTEHIIIKSPKVSNGEVLKDDGLFSPLTKITSVNEIISGVDDKIIFNINWEFDNYVLRRKDENEYYKISSLTSSFCGRLINDKSFVDFFKNINKTLQISRSFIISNLNILEILFYSKVSKIDWSFISTDENINDNKGAIISLKQFFNNPDDVKELSSITSANGQSLRSNSHSIILHDGFFDGCDNLTSISDLSLKCKNIYFISTEDRPMPYKILQPIKNKITSIPCLFEHAKAINIKDIEDYCTFTSNDPNDLSLKIIEGENYKDITITSNTGDFEYTNDPMLPHTMFSGCSKITNLSYFFYDITFINSKDYRLTETKSIVEGNTNFIDCTSLKTISYIFGRSKKNNTSKIISMIPNRLFFNGKNSEQKITIEGTRDEELTESTIVEKHEINYSPCRTTITSAEGCFIRNISNVHYYEKLDYSEEDIEPNLDYQPFTYLYKNGKWGTSPAIKNEKEYTYSWYFDGFNEPAITSDEDLNNKIRNCDFLDVIRFDEVDIGDDYKNKEESDGDGSNDLGIYSHNQEGDLVRVIYVKNSLDLGRKGTFWNYLIPPDIFRYFAKGCNISNMFSTFDSDRPVIATDSITNPDNLVKKSRGRLCPYLLKPLTIGNTGTSTTSLYGLFTGITNFNYYEIKKYNYYKVGDGKKLINLGRANEGGNLLTLEEKLNSKEIQDINENSIESNVDIGIGDIIKSVTDINSWNDKLQYPEEEFIENWIIPKHFFWNAQYSNTTFNFERMFACCYFPNNPKLSQLLPNKAGNGTYYLNEMFYMVTWDTWYELTELDNNNPYIVSRCSYLENIFNELYVSSGAAKINRAVSCFQAPNLVKTYKQIAYNAAVYPSYSPKISFKNIFPKGYTGINNETRFKTVFYNYKEDLVTHEDPKTLINKLDNYTNYKS